MPVPVPVPVPYRPVLLNPSYNKVISRSSLARRLVDGLMDGSGFRRGDLIAGWLRVRGELGEEGNPGSATTTTGLVYFSVLDLTKSTQT